MPPPRALNHDEIYPDGHENHTADDNNYGTPDADHKDRVKHEFKGRLRKACDSCSLRKVKCDEQGPPCHSCAELNIPCTFDRPTKRRGPPNRHAEEFKRRKLEEQTHGSPNYTSSPTSAPHYRSPSDGLRQLSAESICELHLLEQLINDYFTYIHPLIPLPHEPTFRMRFDRREDRINGVFLALIASMIEALVASFPRRPLKLFRNEHSKRQFPNAGAFIDHCHNIFVEARGPGYLDRARTVDEAASSYLAGISAAYGMDMRRCRLYFNEAVAIMRSYDIHRGQIGPDGLHTFSDLISQEMGRRLFWLCYASALSARMAEGSQDDMMSSISRERLVEMPAEVDDRYIMPDRVLPQPLEDISTIHGFNLNASVFKVFHVMVEHRRSDIIETGSDWPRQRQAMYECLLAVKELTTNARPEIQLSAPPLQHFGSPPPTRIRTKRETQLEIQKANIYASQLATRSWLVEQYWDSYDTEYNPPRPGSSHGSPIAIRNPRLSVDAPDGTSDFIDQVMASEREMIVRDLALLLQSVDQVSMEPNSLSFCSKVRAIASTLLRMPRSRMSMPSLDPGSVNLFLTEFIDILLRLERLSTGNMRGEGSPNSETPYGDLDEMEERELVQWASLKERQERFARESGFLVEEDT